MATKNFSFFPIIAVVLLLLLTQKQLWLSEAGLWSTHGLNAKISEAEALNKQLTARNQELLQSALIFKTEDSAIELQARQELGLIQQGEVFYQLSS